MPLSSHHADKSRGTRQTLSGEGGRSCGRGGWRGGRGKGRRRRRGCCGSLRRGWRGWTRGRGGCRSLRGRRGWAEGALEEGGGGGRRLHCARAARLVAEETDALYQRKGGTALRLAARAALVHADRGHRAGLILQLIADLPWAVLGKLGRRQVQSHCGADETQHQDAGRSRRPHRPAADGHWERDGEERERESGGGERQSKQLPCEEERGGKGK